MQRFRQSRRSVNAVFAIWMMVIGVGVSVSHAHAEGERNHIHGSGWNHGANPVLPVNGAHGRGELHRHLILLGVEFPNESAAGLADANVTEPAVESACDWEHSLEFAQALAVLPAPGFSVTLHPVFLHETCTYQPSTSSTLSTFARRLLTGVLRS